MFNGTLQLLETVVKNCGSPIHDAIATKAFMDELYVTSPYNAN